MHSAYLNLGPRGHGQENLRLDLHCRNCGYQQQSLIRATYIILTHSWEKRRGYRYKFPQAP
jgi:hypothetical protein